MQLKVMCVCVGPFSSEYNAKLRPGRWHLFQIQKIDIFFCNFDLVFFFSQAVQSWFERFNCICWLGVRWIDMLTEHLSDFQSFLGYWLIIWFFASGLLAPITRSITDCQIGILQLVLITTFFVLLLTKFLEAIFFVCCCHNKIWIHEYLTFGNVSHVFYHIFFSFSNQHLRTCLWHVVRIFFSLLFRHCSAWFESLQSVSSLFGWIAHKSETFISSTIDEKERLTFKKKTNAKRHKNLQCIWRNIWN